jgi:excisionase family DNA binding protein
MRATGDKARMQQTAPTNRLGLSASQAARALGVSVSTVRRWSDSGALPGYRTPGGQRRFSREQLDAFVASLQRGDGSASD